MVRSKWINGDNWMQGIRDKKMDNSYEIFELKRFIEWNNLKTKWGKSGSDTETSIFSSVPPSSVILLEKRHEILMI